MASVKGCLCSATPPAIGGQQCVDASSSAVVSG